MYRYILPLPRLHYPSVVLYFLRLMLIVVAVYTLINTVTTRYIVDGRSMWPAFEADQFLLVNRMAYQFGEPTRSDVVVLYSPVTQDENLLKRIVGLPGDAVGFRDSILYINGEVYNEAYLNEPCDITLCPDQQWQLAADQYFVMGDNRNRSTDSRVFGPIDRHRLVGPVQLALLPAERVLCHRPLTPTILQTTAARYHRNTSP